jgi:hypothetical protein
MPTPARSIASLTISFGLVSIPVKLYSATLASERISFNLLRQTDGSRVKQQFVAVAGGRPAERAEMTPLHPQFSKFPFFALSHFERGGRWLEYFRSR